MLSFSGVPFPKDFIKGTVKKILTRLFRVFVHVYIHHFDKLVAIGAVSSYEPVHDKTNNLGFQPGPTQTGLYSHRNRRET